MVFRYANALRDDEALGQKLLGLRMEPRRWAFVAAGLICGSLLIAASIVHGFDRVLPGFFGSCVLAFSFAEFAKEHKIVQNWSASVGTVLNFRKFQYKKGARIKYAFRASNGLVHLGRFTGNSRLPKEGATLVVLYHSAQPDKNHPLFGFLFYKSSFNRIEGDPSPDKRQDQLLLN